MWDVLDAKIHAAERITLCLTHFLPIPQQARLEQKIAALEAQLHGRTPS